MFTARRRQGNELRDMRREQGWSGDTLLNGDECAPWGWLAALTTEQKARQASDPPHQPLLTASQINNSTQSALTDFIFPLIVPPPPPCLILKCTETADWTDLNNALPATDRSIRGDLTLFSQEYIRFSWRLYFDTRLVSFLKHLWCSTKAKYWNSTFAGKACAKINKMWA